ncbi:pentapeptide repeat-containing protein [Dermacoccaceae bacterium W4C1]
MSQSAEHLDQTFTDAGEVRDLLSTARQPLTFTRCDLTDLRLRNVDASEISFVDCTLDRIDLEGARLGDASFTGCRMTGANLSGVGGLGFRLERCNLFAADLSGAPLPRADLTGCRLTEAVLRKADLRWAIFDGCDLSGTDLYGAQLEGADLRGAALGEVDGDRLPWLRGAIITPRQATEIVTALAGVTVLDV